jgi:hypothetical protein
MTKVLLMTSVTAFATAFRDAAGIVFMALSRRSIKGFDWFYFIPILIPFIFIPGFLVTDYRSMASVVALIQIAASAVELMYVFVKSCRKNRTVDSL